MTRSSGKRWLRTLALFLLLLAAARFTDCSPTLFWARRSHLTDLISAMLPPDWGYAPRILAPLLATVQMSVTGTALGSFLALLLAPLCAENLHAPKPLRWTLRLLVQVLRSFPTLILALLATFLFGLGTFSGTVAITVYTFAILTRLTYEDIESAELAPTTPCAPWAPHLPKSTGGPLCRGSPHPISPMFCTCWRPTCATVPFWAM